jgi:hypothetical protein
MCPQCIFVSLHGFVALHGRLPESRPGAPQDEKRLARWLGRRRQDKKRSQNEEMTQTLDYEFPNWDKVYTYSS